MCLGLQHTPPACIHGHARQFTALAPPSNARALRLPGKCQCMLCAFWSHPSSPLCPAGPRSTQPTCQGPHGLRKPSKGRPTQASITVRPTSDLRRRRNAKCNEGSMFCRDGVDSFAQISTLLIAYRFLLSTEQKYKVCNRRVLWGNARKNYYWSPVV